MEQLTLEGTRHAELAVLPKEEPEEPKEPAKPPTFYPFPAETESKVPSEACPRLARQCDSVEARS